MHFIHRGIVNKKYKENLISSFKKSFSLGYGIETDIHLTKDREFVCFHDFTLNRIFKKKASIKNLNYPYIKELSINQNKEVPLLKDVLKISKNKYPLLIELKPKLSKKNLQKLIKEVSKYSKCIFISFNHQNIFNLQKIKPNIKVGLSFSSLSSCQKGWRFPLWDVRALTMQMAQTSANSRFCHVLRLFFSHADLFPTNVFRCMGREADAKVEQ